MDTDFRLVFRGEDNLYLTIHIAKEKDKHGKGKKRRWRGDGEVSNGVLVFGCDEVRRGVSKDILELMFHESDHISSKHGRQLQETCC